jgi:hypothetical protein
MEMFCLPASLLKACLHQVPCLLNLYDLGNATSARPVRSSDGRYGGEDRRPENGTQGRSGKNAEGDVNANARMESEWDRKKLVGEYTRLAHTADEGTYDT